MRADLNPSPARKAAYVKPGELGPLSDSRSSRTADRQSAASFVNGSMPVRFFFAGTLITFTFNRPGIVKLPRPFLCTDASIVASSDAMTALTWVPPQPFATGARSGWCD